MTDDKYNELEKLILCSLKEVLISNNKIYLLLNMLQNQKIADKNEIKKSAEKNADKIINDIISKMNTETGMTAKEYEEESGNTIEENERAREEFEEIETRLTDINDEDLYGDDE